MGATGQPEVRVLGGLEIDIDGVALRLDGPRRRALVALLAAQRGTPRTADWIATHLWRDGDRPADATMTVRVYVSRLRRMSPDLIVTEANGYALASTARLDTDLAARRHDDAIDHCRAGRPEEATASLRSALATWRGRSFQEFADVELLAAAGSTWDRRRADIAVVLADLVDVVDGAHLRREVAAALHTIVSDDPAREDVVLRLALLHARLGAPTAALHVLDRLANDIGGLTDDAIDLREAIVADDLPPVLTWQRYIRNLVAAPAAPAAPRWGRPARPRVDRQLLGRERELAAVHQSLTESRHGLRLVLVVGPAGIGKSELIAHVAAQHADLRW
ncbi:MAG: BTAD domain-containing putative transcriptional regulator, partial [Ilumatobacteraceae bacterium]